MLIALSTGLRLRLALVLAAFAAFCFVAPPAVLAFGHGEHAVQCLTHADAVDHDMSTMAKANGHSHHWGVPAGHHQACCGLFCLSALMPAGEALPQRAWFGVALAPSVEPRFLSLIPDFPDPPPIPLPSV
jgi:hypothetical protein